jgi:hypothetical protein
MYRIKLCGVLVAALFVEKNIRWAYAGKTGVDVSPAAVPSGAGGEVVKLYHIIFFPLEDLYLKR